MLKSFTRRVGFLAVLLGMLMGGFALAQDDAGGDAGGGEAGAPSVKVEEGAGEQKGTGFFDVVAGSGFLGIVLWLALFGTSIGGVALLVDSFVTVRETKIIPEAFVFRIKEAMEMGDVMKAQKICEEEPGPLSNILLAGFSNVEEGFEAIQDSISVSADLESEKLLQRVNYLNVVGNLAPMLGLLGTVQGMIYAFANLASGGAAKASMLAINISQALYTTAAGLFIAVPALAFFYFFRNRATRIILNMEALTLEEIKILRHAEVIDEEEED